MMILVAEDHPEMREFYARVARSDGHDVQTCSDGAQALEALARQRFDLVILDLRMPLVDGFDVCRRMRGAGNKTPVLALTGIASEQTELEMLDLGADDYVVKPCSFDLLRARIRALLRRSGNDATHRQFMLGRWTVDYEVLEAMDPRTGQRVPFTKQEMRLLALLVERGGAIVSRDEILTTCWRGESGATDNALSAAVGRLRRKISGSGVTIKAQRTHGLRLEVDTPRPRSKPPRR